MRKLYKKILVIMTATLMLLTTFNCAYLQPVTYAAETNSSTVDNKNFHGFELVSEKNYPDLNSDIYIYRHIKTGAKLMYVKNDDTQRVFSISFRTPAEDDTGVNHIIEHSVLDGSKNYPLKSPFKELLKGSLGTFINALTYPDYTSFPVASTNEQDLKNLMGVYLDAVFNPNVLTDDNIFKQEGWRYELPSIDSPLTINGVVYNEMKGNYSDPQTILQNAINQSLFPDTSYQYESGGNPDVIPTLTKDHLVQTYHKYYNPSNSYIYLYGKMDIGSYLDYIDQNYLSKFDKTENDTSVKLQKPLTQIPDKIISYSVAKDSDTKNKAYLSLNFVTGSIDEKEKNTALGLLDYLLTGTDEAPVKKAITNLNIAENFASSFQTNGIQPVYSFYAINSNEASKDIFQKTIMDTLKNIAQNGFDKKFLKSALTSYKISKRSEALLMPILGGKGLNLSNTALSTWMYDKDPELYFDTSDVEKKIMNGDCNHYFQNLIKECFLNNSQHSIVIANPVAGLEDQYTEKQKDTLAEYKKKIGSAGCQELMKATESYNKWQSSPDSKEALATLPKLSLKDIKPELPALSYKVTHKNGVTLLNHSTDLEGFSSINLYFDTSNIPKSKLHYLNLLTSLLGNINTKKHSSQDLSNRMAECMIAPVTFAASANANYNNTQQYSPKLAAAFIVPDENISEAFSITDDIMKNTVFTDKKKIRDYIKQNKSAMQLIFGSGSGSLATLKLGAYMSKSGQYNDELTGESYYQFLTDLNKHFDSKWAEISKNLEDVYKLAFHKTGLIASHSGSKDSNQAFIKGIDLVTKNMNSGKLVKQNYKFPKAQKNIAYSTAGKVQTVITAGNFKKAGYQYSGKMMVLQNILNMGYLWDKVRTSGGAYGVSASFGNNGNATLASMRDPNLKETLDAFKGTVDYLKNFTATDEEMSNYIIGAIKDYVNLKTSGAIMEGAYCDSMYLQGLTEDDLLKAEKEALTTTADDIRGYANMMDKILKQNIYFVEGSKDKVEQNKNLFKKVINSKY